MSQKKLNAQTLKNIAITAICIALCLLLPQLFHLIPSAGKLFSPMHIPILICGLACSWQYGLICGISGVTLSSLIMSMPTFAQLPGMVTECAVYGLAASLLIKRMNNRMSYKNIYISLVCAMLLGRIAGGIAKAIFFTNTYSFSAWVSGYFVTSFPAIILQLIIIPPIIHALTRSGFIGEK
ncbi:MAG: ECF transporter S component [Clostridia bacterium]|nr:ECF transporter S component [Clostridia bacterium]